VRHSLAALLFLFAGSASAQSVRVEVDTKKLAVDDSLQLQLTVEGNADLVQEVQLPPLQNLRVAGGPSLSTQVSIVGGSMSQQRVYTWVLQPAAVGKAEVGAFTVQLRGGAKTTEPIAIEVVKGSIQPPRQRRQREPLDPFGGDDPFERFFGRRSQRGPAPKLAVRGVPSRDRLHVGESLVVTYYVYTQVSLTGLRFADAPQYPGFWSEDLESSAEPQGEVATLDGERFQRFPVARKLLFPTRAGTLTIPAAGFKIGVAGQGFFDAGPGEVARSSEPVTVTVEPIPETPGFSGAVGRFRAGATLDKNKVAIGEAATLRFKVEGTGNLKWVDKPPELKVPGAKVYPPTVKSDLKAGPEGIAGSKTWEFVIVPETAGALDVPPLGFSYFDPAAGKLARAETRPLPLAVEGAMGVAAAPAASAAAPLVSGAGGLKLRAELDLGGAGPRLGARTVGWTLLAALAVHGALLAGPATIDRLRRAQGRPAPQRQARAALVEIERVAKSAPSKELAAAALERALHGVFGSLDGAPEGERERAARAVLQEVQFLRYAPQLGDYSEKIREVAARAAEVVRRWA
jgi:hypothetical protein